MSGARADYLLPLTEVERVALQRLLEESLEEGRREPRRAEEPEYHVMLSHEFVLLQTLVDKVRNLSH